MIDDLNSMPIASARAIFDDEAGIEASDLTAEEIDCLRAEIYAHELSSLEERQRQERESGFKEKRPISQMFFRKGKIGS